MASTYSVQEETRKILQNGILNNPLIAKDLPADAEKYASKITLSGSPAPSIPINWRFAESISSLKALESIWVNELLVKKYGVEPQDVEINTDHASLFFMSVLVWSCIKDNVNITSSSMLIADGKETFDAMFRTSNIPVNFPTRDLHQGLATNIYKTTDNRFFHTHGSLDADPTITALGLPPFRNPPPKSLEEGIAPYIEAVGKLKSDEIQKLMSDEYKQAGTICWSTEEYKNSEHGKANAHVGLYEVHPVTDTPHPASWWPSSPQTSPSRPLAGLKVLDLTRIIAAPSITRGLAELGASVLRIVGPHLPDSSQLHADLHWGKWNAHLDFKDPAQLATAKELILDADVVVSGYRPGVMEKYGLDPESIIKLVKDSGRERGIIVARENCYGWNGPWAYRSGWQQISDACCGVSRGYSDAMGNPEGEAVTPVFPNSDYCTGVAGLCGILDALVRRGTKGGSYKVDVALNYYSQWLINSVGTYPSDVWKQLWSESGMQPWRHYQNMGVTIPAYVGYLMQKKGVVLFKPEFFHEVESKAVGARFRCVRPIIQYKASEEEKVKPGFNVGTRGNGFDAPKWPEDLMVEIIA